MRAEKIYERILALRAEISGHVKGEADLASEKTLELSRRLDELITAYYKCIAGKGGVGQE
ncbi:MAG: aspartyl-phosphate phosphatase Spo0E family protein [Bacillota bacterium]|jgi:hypothetical protein|nr:aspartyl-phosphate phosphatase Spo0E family protein [Bacillota bacterium]